LAEENLATGAIGARRLGNRPPSSADVFRFRVLRPRDSVAAWYTDLNQDDDVFRYAYVVGEVTYAGKRHGTTRIPTFLRTSPEISFREFSTYRQNLGGPFAEETLSGNCAKQEPGSSANLCIFFFGFGCISFVVGNASPEKSEPFSMAYWQASPQS